MPLLAGALRTLGSEHALVVHGAPGIDEISPLGRTRVLEVRDGTIRDWTIEPAEYGFAAASPEELAGGDPQNNATVVVDVLSNRRGGGARAAVLLNAAAALYIGGKAAADERALELSEQALSARAGLAALERLRRAAEARSTGAAT